MNKYLIKYLRTRESYIKDKVLYQKEYLFLSQKGKQLTPEATEHVLKVVSERVGIRKEVRSSPYTCRHYYDQTQLKNGLDIYTLSRLLGHNSINITKRYLQSMNESVVMELGSRFSPLSNL